MMGVLAVAIALVVSAGEGDASSRMPRGLANPDSVPILKSAACNYYTPITIWSARVWDIVHPYYPLECDTNPWLGNEVGCGAGVFDGGAMTRWASNNWQIPLIATPLYLVGIVVVRSVMADRQPIRMPLVVAGWNFGLSFFSIAGAAYCVPALLFGVYEDTGLLTQGFYPSVCMQATSWGCGPVGFFVFLFIMSKLAEVPVLRPRGRPSRGRPSRGRPSHGHPSRGRPSRGKPGCTTSMPLVGYQHAPGRLHDQHAPGRLHDQHAPGRLHDQHAPGRLPACPW